MTPSHSRASSPVPEVARWRRIVTVGDSFSEGLWDGDDGALRGWADRLAGHIAALRDPEPTAFANLAIRGRLLPEILGAQLPRALRLRPDLVTLAGGGNDLLRPNGDPDTIAANLERAVVTIRDTGADVLLATLMDSRETPLIRALRGKNAVFNSHVWSIAARHGAYVLDLWGLRSVKDWRMWASDRIHLTSDGHARVADAAAVALGLAPRSPDWQVPLPPRTAPGRRQQLSENLAWAREYGAPWIARRLRRRSSGDMRQPKYPELRDL